MKTTGILLLAISGLLLLCIPLSMLWSFEQVANSPTSPRPADLADGISQSYVFGLWALPVALAGLIFLALGFFFDPKRSDRHDRQEG